MITRALFPSVAKSFALGLLLAACVGGKNLSRDEQDRLRPYILDSRPQVAHVKDVNFDDKIHLIGYKVEPESPAPGTDVKLTYYWQVDQAPGDGWMLFTHILTEGAQPQNLDNIGALREPREKKQLLGPERWERGKFYVDEQTYRVPDSSPGFAVYVGIWKDVAGGTRMPIKSGANDGENRAEVVRIRTGAAAPPKVAPGSDTPSLRVPKLAKGETIVIDGKGDDKAWTTAVSTGAFGDVARGGANTVFPVNGNAKMAWDDANLYVLFDVSDPDVVGIAGDPKSKPADFTATGQPKLWTRDTVEIMIDPDGDGDNVNYFELQINPQNKVFHSQFDTYNQPKGNGPLESGPFGHEDWDPRLKSAVVVKGTIDDKKEKDQGYVVEIAIPWTAFAKGAKQLPPTDSDTWRMNFYAMENNGGVSWSPILGRGNFHFAPRFGRVIWVDPATAKEAGADVADASSAVDEHAEAGANMSDGGRRLRRFDGGALRTRPFLHRRILPNVPPNTNP